jgi:2-succinyl-5-enolpyruvyl-6-hydroxy-3-cyclohexene-1-carboxylate synthase
VAGDGDEVPSPARRAQYIIQWQQECAVIKPENRNILWATILADELARCGVHHAVIAPGSRSTPLAVAFSRDERFTIHSIIDERAAAFFALGLSKGAPGPRLYQPPVLICTSGTAAANFFPAIIEASLSNIPLLVITADRPHELRDTAANQTIDQVRLYGNYVRWFVDVAPPHANPEDKTLRYLRTTIDRAVECALGANSGPVHLNVPFEKPLEPFYVEGDVPDRVWEGIGAQGRGSEVHIHGSPTPKFTAILSAVQMEPDLLHMESVPSAIHGARRGLFILGADAKLYFPEALVELSKKIGYPILAEAQSGLRFNSKFDSDVVFAGYETYLRGEFARQLNSELIVQFGNLPVGSSLLNFLADQENAERIVISPTGKWLDDSHRLDLLVQTDGDYAVQFISGGLEPEPCPHWLELFRAAEHITWQAIAEMPDHEGAVSRDIVEGLRYPALLFVASSNPIRHLDQFVPPQTKHVGIRANRGASGIDGTIATAVGISAMRKNYRSPLILVIGDLALYHDLNSLHLIRRLNIPLVIVCINNDGGGIFHRLPIANYDPPFRDLFVTPHGLTFEHAAKMFDIPYTLANMGEDFRAAFKAALDSGQPHLIEVPSDAAEFERQRKQLIDTVAQRIAESGILEKFKASQEKHSQGSTPRENKRR